MSGVLGGRSKVGSLRVMHVIASSASGGASVNVARLIARSRMVHFVVVQRDEDVNWNRLASCSREIHDLPIRRIRLSTFWRLFRLVRRHRIDVLHSHGPGAGLYARTVGLITGTPVVHTYRGFHNRYEGFRRRLFWLYERGFSLITARAIAVSQSERRKVLAEGVIKAEKIEVVLNPISLPDDRREDGPGLLPGRFNVVSLSRISPQKDLLTLIEVARELGDGFVFHVIGGVNSSDVEYAVAVRDRLAQTRVSNVVLHGDIPGAAAFLHRYDAYLSTALWEGMPTAVVEAFLAGVAVVATDCTGNCDVVRHQETGLLCVPGDAPGIAAALRRLASDVALRQRLREAAMTFARAEFDINRLVERMDSIYDSVVERG